MISPRTAAGGLPALGQAFAAGLISREHVDVAVQTIGTQLRLTLNPPPDDTG